MQKTKFKKLGLLYMVALSAIAVSVIVSQFLVQLFIGSQSNDSKIINVAGRQRMLSQKITKLVLQLKDSTSKNLVHELGESVVLWETSHHAILERNGSLGLDGENSEEVIELFKVVTPYFSKMLTGAKDFLIQLKDQSKMNKDPSVDLHFILMNEPQFLKGMDNIVTQYEKDAKSNLWRLRWLEFLLFFISISIIVLELLFVFRPIAKNVRATMDELTHSEKSSNRMAKEMSKLYDELVKSYQDLEAVNIDPKPAKLLGRVNKKGAFLTGHNDLWSQLQIEKCGTFQELLTFNDYSKEFVRNLLLYINKGENWLGELKLINSEGDFIWLEVFLVTLIDVDEVKIIGRDVTEIKEAKMISREINSEKIARKVKEQQYRSVLILEGQEEERKRLARELHDGVGQMLSALKLSLESVSFPKSPAHNKKKFDDTKDLLKSVIQEIRRISFNIIPTNLVDFGIVPATRKLCKEISKLSNTSVLFENKSSFINRLEEHVESNLYRIIQEGVNNAIKYSNAKTIKVSFSHNLTMLQVVIEDDGKGFNMQELLKKGHFKSSGHGIYNMKERAAYINAALEIDSSVDAGTKISVNLPLE